MEGFRSGVVLELLVEGFRKFYNVEKGFPRIGSRNRKSEIGSRKLLKLLVRHRLLRVVSPLFSEVVRELLAFVVQNERGRRAGGLYPNTWKSTTQDRTRPRCRYPSTNS